MTDISNKTLAILVGVAIVVSLVGILTVPKPGVTIIGAVTNTTAGTANVTINQVTQITLVNNSIDFGSGFVNSSGNNCTLFSNGTIASKPLACQGFNQPAVSAYFVVENNGNVNVTLDINGSFITPQNGSTSSRVFLCNAATTTQNCTQANPDYRWDVVNQEAGSCDDPGFNHSDFGGANGRVLNGTTQRVCTNFDYNASANSLLLPIKIVIPRDSRTGTLNDTVTFIANTG